MNRQPLSYYTKQLLLLIFISTIVRALIASIIELGNDEVYYRIFALFPQLSYYDHPPLLSLLIRLTTLASEQPHEILIRLSSIIIGGVNTYIIYRIAKNPLFSATHSDTKVAATELTNSRRGLYAAILYTGSIYCSVIVGIFIMPDTPMSLFWLLAMLLLVEIVPKSGSYNHYKMLSVGLLIGLTMLSKYTGLYLWGAVGLYIVLFNRELLKKWSLYIAPLVSVLVFSPVLIWNADNEFISFTFHSGRIVAQSSVEWLYFGREIFGGIFYNSPINFALIVTSLVVYWGKKRHFISSDAFRLLLCFSLPMILLFLSISLTRSTLPHWAAPGYLALIILAAAYVSSINKRKAKIWGGISIGFTALVVVVGVLQINFGIIEMSDKNSSATELGRDDVTLDMYGWRQFGEKFTNILDADIRDCIMPSDADIYSSRWFEAAHLDCYVALPNSLKLKTIATLEDSHLYDWITRWRGGVNRDKSAYFIVSSRCYDLNSQIFSELDIMQNTPCDTVVITRGAKSVENFFIYRINPIK